METGGTFCEATKDLPAENTLDTYVLPIEETEVL